MTRIPTKLGALIILAVIAVPSLNSAVYAGEKKRVTISAKLKRYLTTTTLSSGDITIGQEVRLDTQTSSDPNFNDIEVMVSNSGDTVAGTGTHHGYVVSYLRNGDVIYDRYEGTHRIIAKDGGTWEGVAEGRRQLLGGTGKFKEAKGSYTYTAKFSPAGLSYELNGEVEY